MRLVLKDERKTATVTLGRAYLNLRHELLFIFHDHAVHAHDDAVEQHPRRLGCVWLAVELGHRSVGPDEHPVAAPDVGHLDGVARHTAAVALLFALFPPDGVFASFPYLLPCIIAGSIAAVGFLFGFKFLGGECNGAAHCPRN